MSPAELILRILLALIFPPLGVLGLKNFGCGTLLLLLLLTLLFYVPGQIVAIIFVAQEYSKTSH